MPPYIIFNWFFLKSFLYNIWIWVFNLYTHLKILCIFNEICNWKYSLGMIKYVENLPVLVFKLLWYSHVRYMYIQQFSIGIYKNFASSDMNKNSLLPLIRYICVCYIWDLLLQYEIDCHNGFQLIPLYQQ